ncbi:MAG: bifunctional DNA-formamidopyrimidine glycosylase/DNA-(apurinic or apyrimidinic site) lyase [Erysipelothrix sp.]|jgi:formamidopyrimidine-DNA glycosylase|nr:bifunctional DNA-formamidopyrimidine glycosylase/DNA-(apurinic or apyrimidinic site) lyase [Erysipelothrix sp.]
MPELPEVQTVIATLMRQIKGKTITDVHVITPSIIQQDVETFKHALLQQTIIDIKRRGKYIILILEKGFCVMHLRMEGRFFIETTSAVKKHVHVVFEFHDGTYLHYHDTRKFGHMVYLVDETQLHDYLSHLGIEFDDPQFSGDYLYELAKHRKRSLKSFLLAQEFIAGIGNIYADEICFYARLHPDVACHKISRSQWALIAQGVVEILEKAIASGGTTIYSYINSEGISGRFQLSLQVHLRQGEPCYVCQTPIIKTVVVNRGTYLCPVCQRKR